VESRQLPSISGSAGHGFLGRYRLHEPIGQGATAIVYRAVHPTLEIPVAVKVFRPDVMSRTSRDMLATEARNLARIDHPNIVRVWDYGQVGTTPFLVMEYVHGRNLLEVIHHDGRLSLARATRVIDQIAAGLDAVRRAGLVHRDVKPGNILLCRSGAAKLADLGIANRVEDRVAGWCGTPGFMAPEQASGLPVDHRADQFALGMTLFMAITGCLPNDPEAPRLPAALARLISRMTATHPSDRFPAFDEFRQELAAMTARGVCR
jgi:serine/threonine protein kinase